MEDRPRAGHRANTACHQAREEQAVAADQQVWDALAAQQIILNAHQVRATVFDARNIFVFFHQPAQQFGFDVARCAAGNVIDINRIIRRYALDHRAVIAKQGCLVHRKECRRHHAHAIRADSDRVPHMRDSLRSRHAAALDEYRNALCHGFHHNFRCRFALLPAEQKALPVGAVRIQAVHPRLHQIFRKARQ